MKLKSNPLALCIHIVLPMAVLFGTTASFMIFNWHKYAAANSTAETTSAAKLFFVKGGIALQGIDPVAYFTEGRPVAGRPEFAYEWQGITWLFSSAENQTLFANNPRDYAPKYGGYCAYGVSYGVLLSTVPEAWIILDGKLYLHYSPAVLKQWHEDAAENIDQANLNWLALISQ